MQNSHITIANTTSNDSPSRIRGLGRYVQALHTVFDSVDEDKNDSATVRKTVVNPFFNIIAPVDFRQSLFSKDCNIAVIHDVIPLTLPQFPWVGLKGRLWIGLNQMVLRLYEKIVTDSKSSKENIAHLLHIPLYKISVAYPYSPLQDIMPGDIPSILPYDLKPYEYLVYVGDVNWHKNIVRMAKAAIEANVKLVCIGGAFVKPSRAHPWLTELREFVELAVQHPDLIIRTGFVDDYILAALFQSALANILVSYDEGFGFTYIEAGHFGTPSILTDAPIFHEISDDKGALFVDPDTVAGIRDQIMSLQKDPSRRKQLGIDAREQSKKYSKDAFRKQWMELLTR